MVRTLTLLVLVLVACGRPCEEVAFADCEAAGCVPRAAQRDCDGPWEIVACEEPDELLCQLRLTSVEHDGVCWRFPDSCVPEGWGPACRCH